MGSNTTEMRIRLIEHLGAAILPGDTPLDGDALGEAADFLLEAGAKRSTKRSALALESSTGERRILRIAVINDDMPFLVDSIAATITALGLSIDLLVHPVMPVTRDSKGVLTGIGKLGEDSDAARESMIYIETPRIDARQRRELLAQLRVTLGDVRAAVSDWPAMTGAIVQDAKQISGRDQEAGALLDWLGGGMLTQLGHLVRHRDGTVKNAKGICRKSTPDLLAENSYERAFEWFESSGRDGAQRELLIIKANRVANVHRPVPLDLFIVANRDGDARNGKVTSLSVHAGVWTSAALASSPRDVPVLRRNVTELTDKFGFSPSGHAGKALIHAFTTLPHDLMIALGSDDIERLATTMMSLVDRPRTRLVQVQSQLKRHVFAFVWLPRDMMSTDVRLQIQSLLTQEPGTEVLDWSLEVEGGALAMLEFLLDVRSTEALPDADAIEQKLEDLLRGWGEAVEHHLAQHDESARVPAIAARYAGAFPQNYRSRYGAAEAALDIERMRLLDGDDGNSMRGCRLYRLAKDDPNKLRLKIYHPQGQLALSDAVPALENFGFEVLAEVPTKLAEGELGTIHEFSMMLRGGEKAEPLLERAGAIEAAIAEVLNGQAEDDPFNRLVVATALDAREADLLRAFYRYLRQTGLSYTIYTVVDALDRAPNVTRAMIELFAARHDPAFEGDREKAAEKAESAFTAGLANVSAINDDRLLRSYKAVVDATLRTNVFAPAAAEALAFKIDSSLMPGLPKPVPWREVFVYSRRVEGIHLRSGAVARGGLRWSDRRDDFRTEVL
ncbi:MAG: NAD-glutamate dehydrogenase domain-containing protein, partial [Pseudomonadota bacterium]